jgi:hypothetical protein
MEMDIEKLLWLTFAEIVCWTNTGGASLYERRIYTHIQKKFLSAR